MWWKKERFDCHESLSTVMKRVPTRGWSASEWYKNCQPFFSTKCFLMILTLVNYYLRRLNNDKLKNKIKLLEKRHKQNLQPNLSLLFIRHVLLKGFPQFLHIYIYILKFGWTPSWMHISLQCMPFFILIIHLLIFSMLGILFFNRNKSLPKLRSEGYIKVDKNELEKLVK